MSSSSSHAKKVIVVANTTWNIQNFRLNIIQALMDRGCQVVTVAPEDEFMDYQKQFPAVRHIALKRLERKGLNPFADFRLFLELRKIYKVEAPDIILQYTIKPNIYGSFAARLTGHNCISVVTGLGYTFIHNGWIKKLSSALYRFAFRSNQKVIFENSDDRFLFIQEKIVEKEKAISVKGCGIDTHKFSPQNEVVEENIFLFIGRLLNDKGIREFVEAAKIVKKKYPDTQFWVAGNIDTDNPAAISEKTLQSWIESGWIDYKGFVYDVREVIKDASCIVLPSYREAIARALQEGMAMEKPVISTNVPGCREAVDDEETGYLVPVKDAPALAQAMERFYQLSADERRIMGQKGRKKVLEQFDERLIAAEFMEIIEGL